MMVKEGVLCLGVLDETRDLLPDESFCRSSICEVPPPGARIIVGRNRCLHPGDLQILKMSNQLQSLSHLQDVLVFSQNGNQLHVWR
jgi:hypothetical protein